MKGFLKGILISLGLYEVKIIKEQILVDKPRDIFIKEFVLIPRVQWDNDDSDAFKRFLDSPLGIKFQAVLCESQMLQNEQVALSNKDYEHACGFAGGFMALKQMILELSNPKEIRIHVEAQQGTVAYLRERLMS